MTSILKRIEERAEKDWNMFDGKLTPQAVGWIEKRLIKHGAQAMSKKAKTPIFKIGDYDYWKAKQGKKRGVCASCSGKISELGEASFKPKGKPSYIRLCPKCSLEIIDWKVIGKP